MKILIAEDDMISRRLLQASLEKKGFQVQVTEDGKKAWEQLQKPDAPQLAILDWMMPGMDGVDVIRKLREDAGRHYTYVLLLTAKNQQEDIAEGLSAGADDYLTKPFNAKELYARVDVGVRMVGLQNELEEHIVRLRELDRLKTEFLSMVSHELRTPLAIMRGGVSLCLDEVPGEINEVQRELLDDTLQNIDQLTRLITDLLDMSKIEAGKIVLHKDMIDLVQIAMKTGQNFKLEFAEKKIRLQTDFPQEPLKLYADGDKIQQIFMNLISNAVRYTGENGSITLKIEENDDYYQCSVADTGTGISEKNMEKLFQKFEQFGRVDGPGYKGTGLGLTIAKEYVKKHGGRIWAESELHKGTVFHFTLKKTAFPRVLIVDDEKNAVDMVKKLLAPEHYTFLEAFSGEEACTKAKQELPSLIVLDMMLPGMNGYQVIETLKADTSTSGIPILILSASHVDPSLLAEEAGSGIPVMQKPIRPEMLLSSVQTMLNQQAENEAGS